MAHLAHGATYGSPRSARCAGDGPRRHPNLPHRSHHRPARQSALSLSWPFLVPRKRCKARGRVLRGCWVPVHGFGVSVRLRGLERVLVVFGG